MDEPRAAFAREQKILAGDLSMPIVEVRSHVADIGIGRQFVGSQRQALKIGCLRIDPQGAFISRRSPGLRPEKKISTGIAGSLKSEFENVPRLILELKSGFRVAKNFFQ